MSQATDSQRALADRLREVLAADARVESAWLSGSFGRGAGDAWSDVDVLAVVEERTSPPASPSTLARAIRSARQC